MTRWWPLLVAILATLVGYLAYGVWGLAGGLAGALAAFVASGAGGGAWVRSLAAALPPLVAVGPSALLVVAVLALVLAAQRLRDPRVYLFGGLALFVPLPGAPFVATAAGALLVATATRGWIAAGAAMAIAVWVLDPSQSPVAGALVVALAILARAMASHPANGSVARGLLLFGAILLCVPAASAVAMAALGALPSDLVTLASIAVGSLLAGGLLLVAHTGLAALHLSDLPTPALWSTLTWAPAGGILLLGPGATAMGPPLAALLPLLGLMTVSSAVGATWLRRSLSRQEVAGKA